MKAYAITAKGQVTIPVSLREELNLKPGDKVIYECSIDYSSSQLPDSDKWFAEGHDFSVIDPEPSYVHNYET